MSNEVGIIGGLNREGRALCVDSTSLLLSY